MKHQRNARSLCRVGIKFFAFIFCLTLVQTAAQAQTLKADYQFQGNLSSSVAGAQGATTIGGTSIFQTDTVDGYSRQTFRFRASGGLSVNTDGLFPTNAYTAVILFRFDTVSGRRRIFDAKQGTSNPCGLYIKDGRLEPEPTTTTVIYPDTYIQVAVSRDASGAMRFYRDGYVTNVPTDSNCYLNTNNNLRFFIDDTEVSGESSDGNVARIRLYDAPMTAAQLRALDRAANSTGGGDQSILFQTTRDGFSEIYSMNADGGNQRRLTNNAVAEYNARWSPDKTKIVFTRNDPAVGFEQIWVMNADGSGQIRLSNSTTNDHAASFRPDGSKILFSRCDSNFVCDIYTMSPNGTNQQPFNGAASAGEDEDSASYSPDGSRIVFTRTNPNPAIPTSGLYALNEDTTNFVRLTAPVSPVGDVAARYSPDGSKIVFARFPDIVNGTNSEGIEIYTSNADSSNEKRITNNNVLDNNPVWSPDGTKIALHSRRDLPINEIYTIDVVSGGTIARLTRNSVTDIMEDWYRLPSGARRVPFDFDGDGRADLSVFRPSNAAWYVNRSTDGFTAAQWGVAADKLAPADYDGDGKTDIAVWREAVENEKAYFYIVNSRDNTVRVEQFGNTGDRLTVGDWDKDGKADLSVYRDSAIGAQSYFYYRPSATSGVSFISIPWGATGDKPARGDFDGDGKMDATIYRPSTGNWIISQSSNGQPLYQQFGVASDKLVPADYDGDGKTDIAVYRDGLWIILQSQNGQVRYAQFGTVADKLVPADYDGDGKVDIAVWRDGLYIILQSANSQISYQQFGVAGDAPVAAAYIQ